jgi:hypothetical protein
MTAIILAAAGYAGESALVAGAPAAGITVDHLMRQIFSRPPRPTRTCRLF